MENKTYEVLEVKGKPGLTVGSDVLKPGNTFTRKEWPYDEENLKEAIKTARCKEVSGSKKDVKGKAENKGGDK